MEELAKLIEEAKKGDSQAYRKIYDLFYQRIFRYCCMNVANREVAKDICQETFVKAWKSLPSFSLAKGGSLQAFLFRIARNLIIDLSRKKKEYQLKGYEHIETDENFIEDFDKKQRIKNLKQALSKLEELDRQIIILRYFEELSTEETAKVVGLSHGALRVRTHRVLKKLKDILEIYAN